MGQTRRKAPMVLRWCTASSRSAVLGSGNAWRWCWTSLFEFRIRSQYELSLSNFSSTVLFCTATYCRKQAKESLSGVTFFLHRRTKKWLFLQELALALPVVKKRRVLSIYGSLWVTSHIDATYLLWGRKETSEGHWTYLSTDIGEPRWVEY